MKIKKIMSIIVAASMLFLGADISYNKDVEAATTASVEINTDSLTKYSSNEMVISLQNNATTVAGVEIFIAYDVEAFTVESVNKLLGNAWELDWTEKSNAKYGAGIHLMVQNINLEGITTKSKDIVELEIDATNATIGKSYEFNVYIIDICDAQGESLKASFAGDDKSYTCAEGIRESDDVNVVGYQMSHTLKGFRTIAAVEPVIDGKQVVEFGNVYGIDLDNLTEDQLYVGCDSPYVKAFAATSAGVIDVNFTDSTTATNYVFTMINNGYIRDAFVQRYMVRAYAKLADGTYVYSKPASYTIYAVADYLYQNVMMTTQAGHEYLYNDILKIVDTNYKKVNFEWDNTIVK